MKDNIGTAYEISQMLWNKGYHEHEGVTVLAMALGIYMEAQEGAHRDFSMINDAMFKVARMTFDAFQSNKNREAGSA